MSAQNFRRLYLGHLGNLLARILDQLFGVHIDLKACALANALPKLLESRVGSHILAELNLNLLGLVANLQLLSLLEDNALHLGLNVFQTLGNRDTTLLGRLLELGCNLALIIDEPLVLKRVKDGLRLLEAQELLSSVLAFHHDIRERLSGENAKLVAILFKLRLQAIGKRIIALVCDDGQHVHAFVVAALTILIYAQTKTATDFLALSQLVLGLHQRADLEHVRVIPALLKGGVAPDKLNTFLCTRLVVITISGKGEQRLFVPHNGLESRNISSRGRRIGRIL